MGKRVKKLHKQHHRAEARLQEFFLAFTPAWMSGMTTASYQAGFRMTGLFPVNLSAIPDSAFLIRSHAITSEENHLLNADAAIMTQSSASASGSNDTVSPSHITTAIRFNESPNNLEPSALSAKTHAIEIASDVWKALMSMLSAAADKENDVPLNIESAASTDLIMDMPLRAEIVLPLGAESTSGGVSIVDDPSILAIVNDPSVSNSL